MATISLQGPDWARRSTNLGEVSTMRKRVDGGASGPEVERGGGGEVVLVEEEEVVAEGERSGGHGFTMGQLKQKGEKKKEERQRKITNELGGGRDQGRVDEFREDEPLVGGEEEELLELGGEGVGDLGAEEGLGREEGRRRGRGRRNRRRGKGRRNGRRSGGFGSGGGIGEGGLVGEDEDRGKEGEK